MAQMGRPRTFDRDVAVDEALQLFWEQGYESTSLSQLKAAIGGGITAPSFYAAFGSKEALYTECMERYLATYAQVTECLWDDALAPRQALELALRRSAKMQCERGHPKGCMVALGVMSAPSPELAALCAPLTRSRARSRAGIRACVDRAIARGELASHVDAAALSCVFDSFLLGLSTLARDGMRFKAMEAAIAQVMQLWDHHQASQAMPGRTRDR
ncbi:AcrR family transcriptional regulator [Xanthomonas arboricola]|uniref:TetR/AcrR family transcriptional regulator n=1 Tax=Xanthomonas cannabis TaxID=1885674 RepID=UPI00141B2885|nr:TetR/AcrR family transcriptional regulator [Xanthomonas cannabis]MCC4608630.1 TetR/AcrR family transcriptional regulator [Xanthomonas campestris pv. zinniae]NIK19163.1 AcrR family transcriptional regulator [Xanthomonas cannabis]